MLKFLPDDISPKNIAACLGLISDTHMPYRWPVLPPSLWAVLDGVDLVLHAGDVGQLWVIDQLSTIAPVIAVHGNDETAEAQEHLPFQQLLTVSGQRILLWHSHYPDRATELAMRRVDTWERILRRSTTQAKNTGAKIVVLGHLHVPFCITYDEILIINPGAIASGNFQTRQAVQTVALLFVLEDGSTRVVHIDLAPPHPIHRPEINWSASFSTALAQYSQSILAEGLDEPFREIGRRIYPQWPEEYYALVGPPAHRVWAGERSQVTAEDLLISLEQVQGLPAGARTTITTLIQSTL